MKIFIYTDNDTDVSFDDVFLSTCYKDIKHFKKENPDLKPLLSYNVKDVLGFDIEKLQESNRIMKEALEFVKDTLDGERINLGMIKAIDACVFHALEKVGE